MNELPRFSFDADDRHFDCQIERGRSDDAQPWCWFSVSGEQHRHPACPSRLEDTRDAIQSRVLSYFRALLTRRALPLDVRWAWRRRLERDRARDKTSARSQGG